MIKKIEINGYNTVEIRKRYTSGDCLCDVQLVEQVEQVETEESKEVIVKSDTNIIFTSEDLMLTEEEIEILNPKPKENNLYENQAITNS